METSTWNISWKRDGLISLPVMCITLYAVAYSCSAASPATVALGDTVPLHGVAPGLDTVYLFLTGPNFPANGVRLTDISVPVVTGIPSTFTRVDVDSDGRWSYTWYTRTAGGLVDAGSYTIWVVDRPAGRLDLQGAEYSTVSVAASRVSPPETGGTLSVTSSPSGAGVQLDGLLSGYTPSRLEGVAAGNHTLTLKLEGYEEVVVPVTIPGGGVTAVDRSLERAIPPGPPPAEETRPEPARTTVPPPRTAAPLRPDVVLLGFVVTLFGMHRYRKPGQVPAVLPGTGPACLPADNGDTKTPENGYMNPAQEIIVNA